MIQSAFSKKFYLQLVHWESEGISLQSPVGSMFKIILVAYVHASLQTMKDKADIIVSLSADVHYILHIAVM